MTQIWISKINKMMKPKPPNAKTHLRSIRDILVPSKRGGRRMAVVGWCLGGHRMGVVMWPLVVMMVQREEGRVVGGRLWEEIVWKNSRAKLLLQNLKKQKTCWKFTHLYDYLRTLAKVKCFAIKLPISIPFHLPTFTLRESSLKY